MLGQQRSRRIWFCLGTAGELIKIYPLLRFAEEAKFDWFVLSTGQSQANFWGQWERFSLPLVKALQVVPDAQDLARPREALRWFVRAVSKRRRSLLRAIAQGAGRPPRNDDAFVVHGDTLSTLVGATWGRRLGVPVYHVEAGLRSTSLFYPFPEELCRRLVSHLAFCHFCQDDAAAQNLRKLAPSRAVINTEGNTLHDALAFVLRDYPAPANLPKDEFVLANIHRFENLHSKKRWPEIVKILLRAAERFPVYLVLHPGTEAKLDEDVDSRRALERAGVALLPRQSFTDFVHYIKRAQYLISDGGSNQEECYYLGKPCLILRDHTERQEGLASGVCVLSRFEQTAIDQFFTQIGTRKWEAAPICNSPSEIILKEILRHDE
jgi:UDP-N-acetylglucosamine 2-epimerase (non-hydrolysing)